MAGVKTNRGNIECEVFVNCAGQVGNCSKFGMVFSYCYVIVIAWSGVLYEYKEVESCMVPPDPTPSAYYS